MPAAGRWWRYGLLGALVLGLSLMCASYAIPTASPTSATTMASMSSPMSGAAVTATGQAPAPGTSTIVGLCGAACASETTTTVCSVIAVAAPLGLLLLLLTRRRARLLGLLARTTVTSTVWFGRERWPGWGPPSRAVLCVWRV